MPSGVDVWDQVVLLNVDGEDLSSAVDDDHAVSLGISCGDEAELVGDLLSEQEGGGGDLVHVQEAHLGDDEDHTELWAILHEHREVTSLLHLKVG